MESEGREPGEERSDAGEHSAMPSTSRLSTSASASGLALAVASASASGVASALACAAAAYARVAAAKDGVRGSSDAASLP